MLWRKSIMFVCRDFSARSGPVVHLYQLGRIMYRISCDAHIRFVSGVISGLAYQMLVVGISRKEHAIVACHSKGGSEGQVAKSLRGTCTIYSKLSRNGVTRCRKESNMNRHIAV